jgi:hypothetical protein
VPGDYLNISVMQTKRFSTYNFHFVLVHASDKCLRQQRKYNEKLNKGILGTKGTLHSLRPSTGPGEKSTDQLFIRDHQSQYYQDKEVGIMLRVLSIFCILAAMSTPVMAQGQALQQCIDKMTSQIQTELRGTQKRCDMERDYNVSIINGKRVGGTPQDRRNTIAKWKEIEAARQRHCNLRYNALKAQLKNVKQICKSQTATVGIGSTWRVTEACPDRKWIATWKLRAGTKTFDATWKQVSGPGSGTTFSDVIDFKGSENGQVSLYRHGLNGTYTGKLTPDGAKIKGGSASWYYSGCYWTAEISK